MQVDNLSELPKDKRPTDKIIWDGTSSDLDNWLDRVYGKNKEDSKSNSILISENAIEG